MGAEGGTGTGVGGGVGAGVGVGGGGTGVGAGVGPGVGAGAGPGEVKGGADDPPPDGGATEPTLSTDPPPESVPHAASGRTAAPHIRLTTNRIETPLYPTRFVTGTYLARANLVGLQMLSIADSRGGAFNSG